MSEKNLETQRRYITELIRGQMKIYELNGRENKAITISLPKVTKVSKTIVLSILEDVLGYKPIDTSYQEIRSKYSSTMLITVVLK